MEGVCRVEYAVAVDLGASSSKIAAVALHGNEVCLEDVYVFPNVPLKLGPGLYWDIFDLYKNIISGLSRFGAKYGKPASIGIDTWGATYGFLDAKGRLAEPVFHYRDNRTSGVLRKMYEVVPKRKIFDLTGCQCAPSYTLTQLYASVLQDDAVLSIAKHLVLLPDLFSYFLGGDLSTERSIAGTTSMLDSSQRDWSRELLDALHIPSGFLLPVSGTGIVKGRLRQSVAEETGLGDVAIVSALGHDSAAAVACIPGFDEDSLYVSMGTNISMGMYRSTPALEEPFYLGGFKNTGGDNGNIIVYRDFPGAWILNNLKSEWEKAGTSLDYDDIDFLARESGLGIVFDIEDPSIQESGNSMSAVIANLIAGIGQPVPQSMGMFIASVYDSIALRVLYYASTLASIRQKEFRDVWLIGGATRYKNLLSRIAGALGRPMHAGFPYASLVGNGVSQFYALGKLNRNDYGDRKEGSSRCTEIKPAAMRDWKECMAQAVETKIIEREAWISG
ncbi:MAG: FGGY family carbohydrate kinase [Treponema sp.]|nr:FGGY family carbohydrate kinase [Treponema sp.]